MNAHQDWKQQLTASLRLACDWLTERSQLQVEPDSSPDAEFHHPHTTWKGTFREYDPASREWRYFAPVWHTGQAVKALVLAHRLFPEQRWLDAARLGVEFIRNNQVTSGEDRGLILSYESKPGEYVRVPGNMECHEGLIAFAEATHEEEWWQVALDSLDWMMRRAYLPDEARFRNVYDPAKRAFMPYRLTPSPNGGKPTLDGGSLFDAYRKTGNQDFLDTGLAVADRLLADEDPPGNWACYGPSKPELRLDHPRHAYWYALPMLVAHETTGKTTYLDAACRSADWFMRAQREDGGQFRGTYHNGKTDSFNHEFSGTACGAIFWIEMFRQTGNQQYIPAIRRALDFLMRVQVREAHDPNMLGAVLSGVLYPDGTDIPRYKVRDLASIFHVQAAALLLAYGDLCQQVAVATP